MRRAPDMQGLRLPQHRWDLVSVINVKTNKQFNASFQQNYNPYQGFTPGLERWVRLFMPDKIRSSRKCPGSSFPNKNLIQCQNARIALNVQSWSKVLLENRVGNLSNQDFPLVVYCTTRPWDAHATRYCTTVRVGGKRSKWDDLRAMP